MVLILVLAEKEYHDAEAFTVAAQVSKPFVKSYPSTVNVLPASSVAHRRGLLMLQRNSQLSPDGACMISEITKYPKAGKEAERMVRHHR